jgi:hypothetical protein
MYHVKKDERTNTTNETKEHNTNPTKNRGELGCSGRVAVPPWWQLNFNLNCVIDLKEALLKYFVSATYIHNIDSD